MENNTIGQGTTSQTRSDHSSSSNKGRISTDSVTSPNSPEHPPSPEVLSFAESAKLALAVRRASTAADTIPVTQMDGETIADAVGVFIAGVRICLLNSEGDEDQVFSFLRELAGLMHELIKIGSYGKQ